MTSPLRRAADTVHSAIESTSDHRRKRSLYLALASAAAAESTFYLTQAGL